MTFLVYIIISICLVLCQTAVFPFFFNAHTSYDLMLVFILYLGFYRPLFEGIPMLFFLGFLMDCLSGSPFGVYTTTYVWLFVAVRATIQYLHVDSRIVFPVAMLSGVLLENIVIMQAIFMGRWSWNVGRIPVNLVIRQLIWAVFTGPVLFAMIKSFHESSIKWYDYRFNRDKRGAI